MVREVTNKLHEAMDEGMLDPRAVADAALTYLSEAQVADMAHINELLLDDEWEDEDDDDDGDVYEYDNGYDDEDEDEDDDE